MTNEEQKAVVNGAVVLGTVAGLIAGALVGGVAVRAMLSRRDPVPPHMRQMRDRYTVVIGWDADSQNIAQCQSGHDSMVAVYRDRKRLKRQAARVRRLLGFSKGVGSEAWFDEMEKADVTAPEREKGGPINLVGTWEAQWGDWGGRQMTFSEDGSYKDVCDGRTAATGRWRMEGRMIHVEEIIDDNPPVIRRWSVQIYPYLSGWGGQATGDYGKMAWAIAPVRK